MRHGGYLTVTAPGTAETDDPGRVRGRRRHGRRLPAGDHGRRHGLHGRARGGEVPGRPRDRREPGPGCRSRVRSEGQLATGAGTRRFQQLRDPGCLRRIMHHAHRSADCAGMQLLHARAVPWVPLCASDRAVRPVIRFVRRVPGSLGHGRRACAGRGSRLGLGQDPDLPQRRGGRQLHRGGRRHRAQPVGRQPPDQRAGARAEGAAVPPPCPRPDPHRAGRPAVPRRARHEAAAGEHPGPPRRDQRAADGRPQGDHHRRARHRLAVAARRRVPRPLSGRADRADPHQRGARSRHARGGRGDPHAPPGPAGPDPAPAVHRALPRLRQRRITSSASASRRPSRTSTSTASSPSAATSRPTCWRRTGWPTPAARAASARARPPDRQQHRRPAARHGDRRRHRRSCRTTRSTATSSLVQVLRETEMPSLESYLVYAEEMRTVARVQAFRDFLVSKAQRWTY